MGSLCFLLFAMGLEQMLHAVVIGMENPISERINNTPWLYVLYGCLAAGIFEETGRYFGFSVLLRNYKEKEVSVAYGIGHGGIETIMTLGLTYGMLALVSLGVSLGDEQTSELLWKTINSAGAGEMCLAMLERVSAMMLHIGLSVLVFAAVRRGKKLLYPLLFRVYHRGYPVIHFSLGIKPCLLFLQLILHTDQVVLFTEDSISLFKTSRCFMKLLFVLIPEHITGPYPYTAQLGIFIDINRKIKR